MSLRRTLLSSIPGAAVTQVRFDDALHEFTTLPGVKEDVTDIILNFKDIVLRVESDEPVTFRLDCAGPGAVTAGDIQTTADVEILNPELHLATINAKGRLACDITVERGRGYVSADRNKRSSTIGIIPVDSIFSPIRLVSFSVEPARVEQSTNYDRLVLDITTDGSITPREALASAGSTLRSLFGLVAEMSESPQGLVLGEVAGAGSGLAGSRPADRGAGPLRAAPQLPEEGPDQHGRRARVQDRGRPAGHHQLRPEVTRRSPPKTGRARPLAPWQAGAIDMSGIPGRPKKGRRFGGDAAHQKAMMGNLVASLIAAEGLVTTEAKAKALRPAFEKCLTKAKKGGVEHQRQVVAFIRDKDMAHKLFAEIAPRYAERPGGYTRILKLGPRHGDNAPMARIELV